MQIPKLLIRMMREVKAFVILELKIWHIIDE